MSKGLDTHFTSKKREGSSMNLDKLGQEMLETGTQVLLSVDAKTGKFLADLMRGNDSVICKPDTSLTEALRQLLHEGSVDKLYCGWSTEDVLALESKLTAPSRERSSSRQERG
jgi:hypothetical protein